jgi:hypothetical protein
MVERLRCFELRCLILSVIVFQAIEKIDGESQNIGSNGKNILFHPCVTCDTIIRRSTVLVVLNLTKVTGMLISLIFQFKPVNIIPRHYVFILIFMFV